MSKENKNCKSKIKLRDPRAFAFALRDACLMIDDCLGGECPAMCNKKNAKEICDCDTCDSQSALCWELWLLENAKSSKQ